MRCLKRRCRSFRRIENSIGSTDCIKRRRCNMGRCPTSLERRYCRLGGIERRSRAMGRVVIRRICGCRSARRIKRRGGAMARIECCRGSV
jgi:hypothetical protein